LEKLKNQLNEKLNEEKINVVKTEQGCSNCNCNNPVPLSNIQAYPTNFMPYHLPHNNYNNFNRRGFNNNRRGWNQNRYNNQNWTQNRNRNNINNYNNNPNTINNNNSNFGPYRPRRRGRSGYPVTAILPFIVTLINLIFMYSVEGFPINCQKHVFTGGAVRCSKTIINECNKMKIPLKINYPECLKFANPIRENLNTMANTPKWKISKTIPDEYCKKVHEIIYLSFSQINSYDGKLVTSKLLEKPCSIIPNYCLINNNSIIWDPLNPKFRNKNNVFDTLTNENIIKSENVDSNLISQNLKDLT